MDLNRLRRDLEWIDFLVWAGLLGLLAGAHAGWFLAEAWARSELARRIGWN